jgi:hypothetical protein
MTALERHCRWLLRAYPAWYRAERGDEMLTTLAENAPPGWAWPGWRETAALVLGGLGVRGQQHHRLPIAANLRLSVMLGLAVSIALLGSGSVGWPWLVVNVNNPMIVPAGYWLSGNWAGAPYTDVWPIAFALTACAPAAAWIGRRAVAVSLLLAAAVVVPFVEASASVMGGPLGLRAVLGAGLPLSLLFVTLAVVTALGTDRPPRAWLCWYALPPAWILTEWLVSFLPYGIDRVLVGLPLFPAFILGAFLWVIVDARPAIALAVVLIIIGVTLAAGGIDPGFGQQIDLRAATDYLASGLVLVAPALIRMRRQAVL